MIQTSSYTFTFQTENSLKKGEMMENIISITEEDAKKHYIQYMQYTLGIDDLQNKIISYRQYNIKVDRYYYLEVANIAIDDRERRRKYFTVLGKRCFGLNDNKIDTYLLNEKHTTEEIFGCYQNYKSQNSLHPILHERIDYATNRYIAYAFGCGSAFFVILNQKNISPRKTFEKNFIVELDKQSFSKLKKIKTHESKIEYIFSKIGKIYFKSLPLVAVTHDETETDLEDAVKKIHYHRSNGISVKNIDYCADLYHWLRERGDGIETAYFNLLSKSLKLIDNPQKQSAKDLFSAAAVRFVQEIKQGSESDEIVSSLTAIHLFCKKGKLAYLLQRQDHDFKDIFIYLLECLTQWNASIRSEEEDIKHFTAATSDFFHALRYFIDTYLEFIHYYSCIEARAGHDAELPKEPEVPLLTSAQEFFLEEELDQEVVEELTELEQDVNTIQFSTVLDEELLMGAVNFFNGYIHVLNTFFEFKNLAYSLSLLSKQLKELDISVDAQRVNIMVKAIIADLIAWKQAVMIEKTAKDIHYMDESFYSNIAQIEIILNGRDNGGEDDVLFF